MLDADCSVNSNSMTWSLLANLQCKLCTLYRFTIFELLYQGTFYIIAYIYIFDHHYIVEFHRIEISTSYHSSMQKKYERFLKQH